MDKLFRKFKKVSNPPKPKHFDEVIKEFIDGDKKIVATFYPMDDDFEKLVQYHVNHSWVKLEVFYKDKSKFIRTIENENLRNIDKFTEDFLEDPDVKGYLNSIKENILPLLKEHYDFENYVNLGTANGWKETPEIILKARQIRETTPYFVELSEGSSIGRCWTKTINHTFKYIYDVDSSD